MRTGSGNHLVNPHFAAFFGALDHHVQRAMNPRAVLERTSRPRESNPRPGLSLADASPEESVLHESKPTAAMTEEAQ